MAVTVVDTGVLIGLADVDDDHHDTAVEIVRGMDHGELPTGQITNYVVLETLNWIHSRKRHQKAIETYERLNQSAGFEVLHAAQKDFSSALNLFETYDGSRSETQPSLRTCSGQTSNICTLSTMISTPLPVLPGSKRPTTRSAKLN